MTRRDLTIEDIGEIVRSGEDVRIIDADGNDETATWLLRWLRLRAAALPKPVMHALVRGVRPEVVPVPDRRIR